MFVRVWRKKKDVSVCRMLKGSWGWTKVQKRIRTTVRLEASGKEDAGVWGLGKYSFTVVWDTFEASTKRRCWPAAIKRHGPYYQTTLQPILITLLIFKRFDTENRTARFGVGVKILISNISLPTTTMLHRR